MSRRERVYIQTQLYNVHRPLLRCVHLMVKVAGLSGSFISGAASRHSSTMLGRLHPARSLDGRKLNGNLLLLLLLFVPSVV